jgi:hypothetical protein
MMSDGYGPCSIPAGDLREEPVSGGPPCLFEGHPKVAGQLCDIDPGNFDGKTVAVGKPAYERLVAVRFGTAQRMVEMGDDQVEMQILKGNEDIQKGDGVSPAGYCNDQGVALREEAVSADCRSYL